MSRRSLHAALLAVPLLACGAGLPPTQGASRGYSPDVPAWRGGCFLSGPAGKIVNGSPAPDVRLFGNACASPSGPGGLLYLDNYDPASGSGDVTVLSSAPGAAPVVIASKGGGPVQPGSTGARLDDEQARVLTLRNVSYVTGELLMAPLPAGTPVQKLATGVRVENYDFLADGGVLYVGNYDAATRQGDLFYWNGSVPARVASSASRFDFVMYRLAPDRTRVAYLTGWKAQSGGDLLVQPLPPGPAPSAPIASGVYQMAWSADGRLVFRTVNPDGLTYALWVWDGAGEPRQVAAAVDAADVVASSLVYTTDWSVLDQRALLHVAAAAGGPDVFGTGAGPASVRFAVAQPPGSSGVLAYLAVPTAAVVPSTGTLFTTSLAQLAPVQLDTGVSTEGVLSLSPATTFVAYSVAPGSPEVPASPSPQPATSPDLKISATAGGPPFVLAHGASPFVAWDPQERFAAALDSFTPAANVGELTVLRTAGGAPVLSQAGVGDRQFGFAGDGSVLWAIRGWDDALARGELVLVPTSGARAWQPTVVDQGVTCVAAPTAGRAIYCVQGEGRDGLWVGGVP